MAGTFSISTIFKGRDRMSPVFNKMSRGAKGFSNIIKGILGASLIRSGFMMLRNGVRAVTTEFVDFENSLTAASAKFGPLFQKGTEGFKRLETIAREVGATTEFTAKEAAEGLDFLALAGFTAAQSMELLPRITDLATASQTDLATASDIASDSLGAFNLMTDDTIQLGTNLNRVMDVMSKTATTANTDLTTMFEAVGRGAPTFTAAGQSLETFAAFTGTLANASIKGSEAGTALRNVMLKLANPTGVAAATLENLGVVTSDANGNFRDVIDILADMENGLKGMGTQQRTAALANIFGARTVTGINVLLAEGSENLRTYRTQLEGATGAAGEMANVMRGSLLNRLKTLKSTAIEIGFKFIEAFKTHAGTAIEFVTNVLRKFDVQKLLSGLKRIFEIIKPLIMAGINLGRTFLNLIKKSLEPFSKKIGGIEGLLDKVASVFNFVAGVINIVAEAINFLSPVLGPLAMFILKAVLGLKAWAIIQAVVNFLLTANPIGLVVAGIAVLVAAIIWVVKNWDLVVEAVKRVWNWFLKLLDNPIIAAAGVIFAPFLTIPALIIKHWEPIKAFFINLWENVLKPIIDGIISIGSGIGNVLGGAIDFVSNIFDPNNEESAAPNERESEALSEINFTGQLNIAGAPEGSTVSGNTTGAPDVRMQLAGAAR